MTLSLRALLSFAGIQTLVHYGARNEKDRQWGLSVFNASLMSMYGSFLFLHWVFIHDITATAFTDHVLYQLQAYLIVDLIYNGFIKCDVRQSLLEFWIHHSVYAIVLGLIIVSRASGMAGAYVILEIPAAIRGWGTIQPEWRSDVGFGTSFFLLRVLLPFVVLARDGYLYPAVFLCVFWAMQTLHCYWFYLWCKSQLPRLIEAALNPS